MSLAKWIPWQLIARKAAKAYGFNDPVETLDRIRKFSRPSETAEPIELLRAGFAFHARGLANTKAIQNNLDWIWPYWIERQYNPRDVSFIPRAFSFSHINLTQRNWTALSVPDSDRYAIVDPRGMTTPFHDSWSLDFWIATESGPWLMPSKERDCEQRLEIGDQLTVATRISRDDLELKSRVSMQAEDDGSLVLRVQLRAFSAESARLVVAIRPYNPEGIQFIDTIEIDRDLSIIKVNRHHEIHLPPSLDSYALSNYESGDVSHELDHQPESLSVLCDAGMATAAAWSKLEAGRPQTCELRIPIEQAPSAPAAAPTRSSWKRRLDLLTRMELPDSKEQNQYEISLLTLSQLSPHDIYPGPYTYKRFWFRDACLIAHALLRTGQEEACRRALERFPDRQNVSGYFLSQEGEWDSNGQTLWIYDLYETLTGKQIPKACFNTIKSASRWIQNKRCQAPGKPHHGLLPAGFSAEHFGPNDYYYWDDFWGVAGLEAAARLYRRRNMEAVAQVESERAENLLQSIETSLQNLASRRARGHLPASPYRRMDSGAIGSLVSDYPLKLYPAGDSRVLKTADFLFNNCLVDGAFFQDMIHSGLNVYLTLDLAQTLLRADDPRWETLTQRCLALATPTGQWPEAVHPRTLGGCMGDGQHAWAAAEWTLMALNRIAREEGDSLIIGSGLSESWIQSGEQIRLANAPTSFGRVNVTIDTTESERLTARVAFVDSPRRAPRIEYRVPGYEIQSGPSLLEASLARKSISLSRP